MDGISHLIKELPEGYEEACMETKAIVRRRGVVSPANLMMLVLFHLLNGCSLMEISEIARLTKLGSMSDVAFMKRFKKCTEWFKWIIKRIVSTGMANYQKPSYLEGYRVIAVDASDVCEKGRAKRVYRLHFALDIFKMEAVQYKITTGQIGETLGNFEIKENDLYIGDRAYSTLKGITHMLKGKGQFILRLRKNCCAMYDAEGERIDLLKRLDALADGDVLDISAFVRGNEGEYKGQNIPVRICATKKSEESIEQTQKKLRRKESRKQIKLSGDTKTFNEYIVLVTSLPTSITAEQILNTYRLRWQVEIYFKRLKSILNLGELPKRDPDSVMAWLNGKLMIALLIEKDIGKASFSPYEENDAEYMA